MNRGKWEVVKEDRLRSKAISVCGGVRTGNKHRAHFSFGRKNKHISNMKIKAKL